MVQREHPRRDKPCGMLGGRGRRKCEHVGGPGKGEGSNCVKVAHGNTTNGLGKPKWAQIGQRAYMGQSRQHRPMKNEPQIQNNTRTWKMSAQAPDHEQHLLTFFFRGWAESNWPKWIMAFRKRHINDAISDQKARCKSESFGNFFTLHGNLPTWFGQQHLYYDRDDPGDLCDP